MEIPIAFGPENDAEDDFIFLLEEDALDFVYPTWAEIKGAVDLFESAPPQVIVGVAHAATKSMAAKHLFLEMLYDRGYVERLPTAWIDMELEQVLWVSCYQSAINSVRERGNRALGFGGHTKPHSLEEGRVLEYKLLESLAPPVPIEAPIQDVLEYRERNREELSTFRVFVDQLHREVLASPDRDWAHDAAVRQLREVVVQAERQMSDKGWRVEKPALQFQISSSTIASALAALPVGAQIANALGPGMGVAAAAATILFTNPNLFTAKITAQKMAPATPDPRVAYYLGAQSIG